MKPIRSILAVTVVLALALLSCRSLSLAPSSSSNPSSQSPLGPVITAIVNPDIPINIPPALDLISSQDALVQLYDSINPGVVAIQVLTQDGAALGSGFVIDTDGHIVTNYHVIENETDLEVTFSSGYKARGDVIGTDIDSDLAVLSSDAPKEELHPLPLGDSDQVKVGQAVIAIGNPFGLEGTMTMGIVSGLGRTLPSLHASPDGTSLFSSGNIIQTDAAINPGNSGGPLLNLNGEVIGINQSIRPSSITPEGPVNSGVGFAVPINMVRRVAPSLISTGKYDYPYLGIFSIDDLSLLEKEALGLPQTSGVYVTEVPAGGPADSAGLQGGSRETGIIRLLAGGDLIIAIDSRTVRSYNDLIGYLTQSKSPGDTVVLTVLRGDQQLDLELVLGKRPDS